MSKRRGIWVVKWPVSSALGWWKRTGGRYCRFAAPTMDDQQENQFEIEPTTNNSEPVQRDFVSERVELKEFAKTLNIGDRIRMFCDDGVLVAEKISQTQFKVLSLVLTVRAWKDGNGEKPGQTELKPFCAQRMLRAPRYSSFKNGRGRMRPGPAVVGRKTSPEVRRTR
jgi:hypothetical protein